MKTTFYFL